METDKILNDLMSTDKDTVIKAMDAIKESMNRNNGSLMVGNVKKLYRGFYNILASHSFDAVHQWTNLLIDLIKNDDPDTEIYFAKLVPILIQNLGSTKIPICTATYNWLKTYSSKVGGLIPAQLKPAIVVNNYYLGVDGNQTNLANIKQYLLKLQGKEIKQEDEFDQLEKELMKQSPSMGK